MKDFLRRKYAALLWRLEHLVERAHPLRGTWIDVGAHRGEVSFEPAAKNPALQVHAFEPNAEAAARLSGRLPNYHVHPVAIAEHDGEIEFHLNAFEAASSTLALDPAGLAQWAGGESLRVESSTLLAATSRRRTAKRLSGSFAAARLVRQRDLFKGRASP